MKVIALLLASLLATIAVASPQIAVLGGAAAMGASSSDEGDRSGMIRRDQVRSFQLGDHSYSIERLSYYDSDGCYGHKLKHAEKIFADIEKNCGTLEIAMGPTLQRPAKAAATELLRESNYFDCGRDQIRVDVVDRDDIGQQCVVKYVNANKKEWVNGAGKREQGKALSILVGMVVGALVL